ncbi:dynein regulatory complex subunit 2 isoform X2 [Procambarus clarkii]|uniref:dynein regulatory complex subunit 2 isoform X2 n=1 Tax=Procambarus clarkii TaxID=6728 RepID=UPI003744A97B
MAPKKKGKGKGDKLARMTVEQRQQYLDRRAAQEAENNRRKQELIAGFLKLKLADEQDKGAVNEAKLTTKWREVLRQASTSTLSTQFQELRTRVTDATTQQERLIRLLRSQVEQAQLQRTQAAHNHLSAVHRLTELHEQHVGVLSWHVREREVDVTRAQATGTEELAARHLHHLRRLSLVSQAALRHHALTQKEELAAFHTSITHLTTQLEEEVAGALVEREATLEEAWARLAVSVRDHRHHTASLRATCHHLQQRVSTNHANLTLINHAIKDIQSEVEEVRRRLRQVERPSDAAQELRQLKKTVMVLRATLASHRVAQRSLIKAINRRGYEAKKELEQVVKEGRAVLELAATCGRLETARDRNLPFLPPPPAPSLAADGRLRTRLTLPAQPLHHTHLGRTLPQVEPEAGLWEDAEEGLGTSLPSAKEPPLLATTTPRGSRSLVETDEGVGSSVGHSAAASSTMASGTMAISTMALSTMASGTVPLPSLHTPYPKGVAGVRAGGRATLGQDKMARISELLCHEEAASEAAHAHPTLHPLPDFVLQEADEVLKTQDDLRNFWRKYHHVQLERLALRSEALLLQEEGRHLRALLRQYFVSLGVTDAALSQTPAPVTVSHLCLSHPNRLPRRRSQSVPAGGHGQGHGQGHLLASCEDWKWPGKATGNMGPHVQEAHLLLRSAALHSLPRLHTG